jgi:hypothetical protein
LDGALVGSAGARAYHSLRRDWLPPTAPTWYPFRLQFKCNEHNWVARQLDSRKISYTLLDNAFTGIEDFAAAQQSPDGWEPSASQAVKRDDIANVRTETTVTFCDKQTQTLPASDTSTQLLKVGTARNGCR